MSAKNWSDAFRAVLFDLAANFSADNAATRRFLNELSDGDLLTPCDRKAWVESVLTEMVTTGERFSLQCLAAAYRHYHCTLPSASEFIVEARRQRQLFKQRLQTISR